MEKIKVKGWKLKIITWLCVHIPWYRKWNYRRIINRANKKMEEQGSPIRYMPYIPNAPTTGNCPPPSLLANSRYALKDVSTAYYQNPLRMVIDDEINKD